MIVLPNSFERYLAALRISVSNSGLKQGFKPQHIENLRKIYTCEALLHQAERQSVDIKKLCSSILGAAATIKSNFKFDCSANGNFLLNKNLLSLLLLNIAKEKTFLKLTINKEHLKITFHGRANNLSPFIKALRGLSLYEVKTKQSLVIIPTKQTSEKSIPLDSEWEYLFDKFSVVNVVLCDSKQ